MEFQCGPRGLAVRVMGSSLFEDQRLDIPTSVLKVASQRKFESMIWRVFKITSSWSSYLVQKAGVLNLILLTLDLMYSNITVSYTN